ncbi:hypothetical protein HJG54_32180 [Leptolyngbya sp. NK1-12]|uniref:Uncharacterized protein n=1 Tax=Leptolyngbya sp. NK1-12 TaxID=2547451 RepID=A0AA96WLW7_9CYAN|nr:hypothetical protein [Leptolyngbya sp. NK1-12]WNZ27534.1 hypothetical protein HJG54_32180 [Leptolyngbya sp. NK1-12]
MKVKFDVLHRPRSAERSTDFSGPIGAVLTPNGANHPPIRQRLNFFVFVSGVVYPLLKHGLIQ